MRADPLAAIATRRTPQSQQADRRQVANNAGGFTFEVDDLARLRRFLTLGTTGGTYYVGEHDLTAESADVVLEYARDRTPELVDEIVSISQAGRAPRQNPALFALAAAASLGSDDGRRLALDALPQVARTGTHLFLFARYIEQFRGWGRGLRRAVGAWYTAKPVDDLAYQVVKYRQREGWSHRDLLRLSHPSTSADDRKRLFDWVCRGGDGAGLGLVEGFQRAQTAETADAVAEVVRTSRLSWEMLPDWALNEPAVWDALLEIGVPQTALMRQLPRLTRLGLLAPTGEWTDEVASFLADVDRLRKARTHPVNVLVALRTYASGHGARGALTWEPSRLIVDALDAAFYAAFRAVEPTGKRLMLALDVSGSMTFPVSGLPLSCREASAALALVTAATEPRHEIVGFTAGTSRGLFGRARGQPLRRLAISPRQRLDDAIAAVSNLPFGATDCSLPMRFALANKIPIDTFVIYTDNQTWAGEVHPHQALVEYRQKMGIAAKLVVVALAGTRFSIADPADPGMLDVSGFDSTVPSLISDFVRGL